MKRNGRDRNDEKRFPVYDPSISLSKQGDWSRRVFIKRTGVFLAAFGVPWLHRMEFMEKMSKNLFGSSTAFAQAMEQTYLISLRLRSGYPLDNLFCTERDADTVNGPLADRNFHAAPDTVITVNPGSGDVTQNGVVLQAGAGTGSSRPLYAAPQLASLLTAGYGNRIAALTAIATATGHTNMFKSSNAGGADWFNAHADKVNSIAPTILPMGIIFGSFDDADFTTLGGPIDAQFSPFNVSSSDDIRGLFSALTLTAPGAQDPMPTQLTKSIFGVVKSKFDDPILALIKDRPGGSVVDSGLSKLQSLLSSNLSEQLKPSQAQLDALNTNTTGGVAAPGSRFATVLGNNENAAAEFFAMAGLLFKLGVTSQIGLHIRTDDWHNSSKRPGANGDDGSGSIQAEHAAYFGQQIKNLLDAFGANAAATGFQDAQGNPLANNLYVTFTSEFTRTIRDKRAMPNNDDGQKDGTIVIFPPGKANAGTYGNYNDSYMSVKCDVNTGADSGQGQLSNSYLYSTISKVLGIDMEHAGVARSIRDNWVKAIKS